MQKLAKLAGIILLFHLGLIGYTNRGVWMAKFDPIFWQDKYEHSQWRLPRSTRGLGDDGLYLYEGYLLAEGADPTLYNAEVPPLGKYLIGVSISWLGNGYFYSLLLTFLSLLAFAGVAWQLFRSARLVIVALALFALDPLLTRQFTLTMLETLQLFFLLTSLLFGLFLLRQTGRGNQFLLSAGAGLAFGFFAASKFPLFAPPLALFLVWLIWQKSRRVSFLIIFFVTALTAYLVPYWQYFYLGHNFYEWLGVQKWILVFYTQSKLVPNYGNFFSALVAGFVQNVTSHVWQAVAEWSPAWPLVFGLSVINLFNLRQKIRNDKTKLLAAGILSLLMAIFLVNLIPFWSRYLLLFLPFFYLLIINYLARQRFGVWLLSLLLLLNFWASSQILFPTPETTVKQFVYDWEQGFFNEMYEYLTTTARRRLTRLEFNRTGQKFFYDAEIEAVKVKLLNPRWRAWQSQQTFKLEIAYFTRNLGPFIERVTLPVKKENGQWRILWDWSYLITNLKDDNYLETNVIPARRGTIFAPTGKPLAFDFSSFLIWLTPQKIDPVVREKMLKFLEEIFTGKPTAVAIYLRYMQNNQPDWPVPIGVVMEPLTADKLISLRNFPAVALTPQFGRTKLSDMDKQIGETANRYFIEDRSLLYSATNYDGIEGWEKEYNNQLKGENGGSLVVKNSAGEILRTLIRADRRDGKDVWIF